MLVLQGLHQHDMHQRHERKSAATDLDSVVQEPQYLGPIGPSTLIPPKVQVVLIYGFRSPKSLNNGYLDP